MNTKKTLFLGILAGLILALGSYFYLDQAQISTNLKRPLSHQEWDDLAKFITIQKNSKKSQALRPASSVFNQEAQIFLEFRDQRRRIFDLWVDEGPLLTGIEKGIGDAKNQLGAERFAKIDSMVINIPYGYKEVTLGNLKKSLSNIHRGMRGLEISIGDKLIRYPPSTFIASNRSLRKAVKVLLKKHNLSRNDLQSTRAKLRYFEASQALILIPERKAKPMFRGNQVLAMEDVNKGFVEGLALLQTSWLKNNLGVDGKMTYKYWPSSGEYSKNNNMIRQWMATVCMIRAAKFYGDAELMGRVLGNIQFNLDSFFIEEDGFGMIEHRGKVKLGALALAALAIFEHPDGQKFATYEKALLKTIDKLWHEDGSFTTFYKSPKKVPKHSNANFYPGEALLLLASRYERHREPKLLHKMMRSIEFYQNWHLNNRNPAFIPWHTQAYYKIWRITKNPALQNHIFKMNDWLLGVQQWPEESRFPDTLGRFYDPSRPFGPPHSSSTGVYLEGLIDAYSLAMAVGDTPRADSYARSIMRGLRSTAQLTFKDDVDMFYIHHRERVKGGVRQTVYNNEIRVDNVQHNLMGIFKILNSFHDRHYQAN